MAMPKMYTAIESIIGFVQTPAQRDGLRMKARASGLTIHPDQIGRLHVLELLQGTREIR